MSLCKLLLLILLLTILFNCGCYNAPSESIAKVQNYANNTINFKENLCGDQVFLERLLSDFAKNLGAVENRDSRSTICNDFNEDEVPDLVVLFTLEGFDNTNLWLQYVVAFQTESEQISKLRLLKLVGGKNDQLVKLGSVSNWEIHLKTTEYESTDASCCPEGKKKSFSLNLR